MSGLFGWSGADTEAPLEVLRCMAAATIDDGDTYDLAYTSTGALGVSGRQSTCANATIDGLRIVIVGHPHPARTTLDSTDLRETARTFLAAYRRHGLGALDTLSGDFALALHDERTDTTILAVDRMGVHRLAYQTTPLGVIFASTLDAVVSHPLSSYRLRRQSIYEYLFFHVVPGPNTIYEDVLLVPPGCTVSFTKGKSTIAPYWKLAFREQRVADKRDLKRTLVNVLHDATARAAAGSTCGAFLSGGTDSSTIAGILGGISGRARTYSIGFDVPGYDELEYARIAARHFGTEHHEHYVTPSDVVAAAPLIAEAYDQPFGNASALPTYFCARLARSDGVERLLGGDGGDELFGGNARYAKQYLLSLYHHLPTTIRTRLIEPLLLGRSAAAGLPGMSKLRSYVEQARLPMPHRYESYNLLEHLGPDRVFTPAFLEGVDRDAPHALMRETHARFLSASLINQMLGIDARFTLVDSDLPKVTRMCALAGVDVAFPLLDDAVVAFSAKLPANYKLNGTRLRYFFKDALSDFLPEEVLRKKKHGFGLPVGEWLTQDRRLSSLARDSIMTLREQKIFQGHMLDALFDEWLPKYPSYYGTMIWILSVLAMWLRRKPTAKPLVV